MSTDPMKQAWQDVAESVSTLGRMLQAEYRAHDDRTGAAPGSSAAQAGAGGPTEPAPDTASGTASDATSDTASSDTASRTASEARLRAAIDRLLEAGRDVGASVSEVAHDPEITSQAKRAASSFEDALTATVNLIADEVSGVFRRPDDRQGSGDDRQSTTWEPPTGDPHA